MENENKILFEDSHIVVCVKPIGMPSQPDPSGVQDLLSYLRSERKEVYLIHRLDRGVGGVLVFAKTKQAAAELSKQVSEKGNFRKTYHAVVAGKPLENGVLLDFLYHDKRLRKAFVVKGKRAGVKEASLTYTTLATSHIDGAEVSLLEIELGTGRFHQIRAQFAFRGHSLVGDGKYGSRIKCPLGLWASRLTFAHPVTKELLSFSQKPKLEHLPFCIFASEM